MHLSGASPPAGSLLPQAAAPGRSSVLPAPSSRLTPLRNVPALLSRPAWDAAAYTALLAEDQSPLSGRLGGWHQEGVALDHHPQATTGSDRHPSPSFLPELLSAGRAPLGAVGGPPCPSRPLQGAERDQERQTVAERKQRTVRGWGRGMCESPKGQEDEGPGMGSGPLLPPHLRRPPVRGWVLVGGQRRGRTCCPGAR